MVPLLVRRLGVSLIVIATAACGSATGPSLRNLVAQRAMWSAQSLTNYSYHFEEAGFFICCTEGQDLTLQVRNDSVVSAVFTATGQPVPAPLTRFPTIDGLFDLASRAADDRVLSGIRFDPQFHYPAEIDLAGPPDASGSEFASRLQPSALISPTGRVMGRTVP